MQSHFISVAFLLLCQSPVDTDGAIRLDVRKNEDQIRFYAFQLRQIAQGNDNMKELLSVTEFQATELAAAVKNHKTRWEAFSKSRNDLAPNEEATQLKEIADTLMEKASDVLLPHQIKSLNQIYMRSQSQRQKTTPFNPFLLPLKFKDRLDLTESESRALKILADEMQSEFAEEERQLRKKLEKEMLELLPKKIREKIDADIGPLIDVYEIKGTRPPNPIDLSGMKTMDGRVFPTEKNE